ncbi:hypothetical protein DK750_24065, partial [Salmonella enterica subsp. enterica serovar Rovaniemi]|nr:hypothetical protein [Salmonella enterica subsp. enterica serovar Rovaniemi]
WGDLRYWIAASRAIIKFSGESWVREGAPFRHLVPLSNDDFKICARIIPVTGKDWLHPNQADNTAITFFH